MDVTAEGVKWLAEWMEKTDSSYKDAGVVLIVVRKKADGTTPLDMVSNEPPDILLTILSSALGRVVRGHAIAIESPKMGPAQ